MRLVSVVVIGAIAMNTNVCFMRHFLQVTTPLRTNGSALAEPSCPEGCPRGKRPQATISAKTAPPATRAS